MVDRFLLPAARHASFGGFIGSELEQSGPLSFNAPTDLIATAVVKCGDALALYARRRHDDWRHIHAPNEDVVPDSDDIYPGQRIRILKPPTTSPND